MVGFRLGFRGWRFDNTLCAAKAYICVVLDLHGYHEPKRLVLRSIH